MVRPSTLKDIETELARLENQREELETRITHLKGAFEHMKSVLADAPQKTTSVEICEAVHEILSEVGRPVHRAALFRSLKEQGIHVNGQNPVGNMTAHMSHDSRFESVGEGNWGLVEWRDPRRRVDPDVRALLDSVRRRTSAVHVESEIDHDDSLPW